MIYLFIGSIVLLVALCGLGMYLQRKAYNESDEGILAAGIKKGIFKVN